MGTLLDRVDAGKPVLWLDFTDYAGQLLASGAIPWLDIADYIAWYRKAQGLLKSDVVTLPVAPLASAWLISYAGLVAEMGKRQRALNPLKALLVDESLRAHLVEGMNSLRLVYPDTPLALVIPSPRYWTALAYKQAFGPNAGIEVSDDEAESASIYVADFLRAFGNSGVDVLLIEEDAEAGPLSVTDIECYRTVLNVASHYRWDIGLRLPDASAYESCVRDVDFIISPLALPDVRSALVFANAFLDNDEAAERSVNRFRFASIPPDARPEIVLERLAALR